MRLMKFIIKALFAAYLTIRIVLLMQKANTKEFTVKPFVGQVARKVIEVT